jgi:CheY-like chemotaxis protein
MGIAPVSSGTGDGTGMGEAKMMGLGRPILIVDDDVDILDALTDTLRDRGFEVLTARNGFEALALLRTIEVTPAVILLDLMMPVMDGYTFLEERRKTPRLAAIPVTILTAGHGVDSSRLRESPPIVPKPIRVPKLLDLLQQLQSVAGTVT